MYVEIDWINNVDMTYVVSTYGVNEVMHSIENFGGKSKSDILTLLYKSCALYLPEGCKETAICKEYSIKDFKVCSQFTNEGYYYMLYSNRSGTDVLKIDITFNNLVNMQILSPIENRQS